MPPRKLAHLLLACFVSLVNSAGAANRFPLSDNWSIQSSASVQPGGAVISTAGYTTDGWYPATVPSTVVGTLVKNRVFLDPYYGMNLRTLPGVTYPIGENFSNLQMPPGSPFLVPWWYRTEFTVPDDYKGKTLWLHFGGINYRANIWLNGRRIAASEKVAGAFRVYEFDVTGAAVPGKTNVLAVEVFPPTPEDLAITWVDWNPAPPDKNMGLWHEVYIAASGPVAVRHPFAVTNFDLPSVETARLTAGAELHNAASTPVEGVLKGRIEDIEFSQPVRLKPKESRTVTFAPGQFPQLNLKNPRLWWPAQVGPQNLYGLTMEFETGGRVSDSQSIRFGVRQVTSEMTPEGYLLFKINGRNILIRGGGWAPDMLLRPDPERQEAEIRYVRDMNLNTIRLEGKLEDDRFLELCDRYGILVMPGWCCCDDWEHWDRWKPENYPVAAESLKDQARRLRSHPSVFVWLNGSDNPPPAKVEKMYIDILKEYQWPNPFVSSATEKRAEFSGPSGVKMRGPYEYVAPSYWLTDKKLGGAYGFNTETSPGPAVPPVESLRRMLPPGRLWPIDDYWNYHAGGGVFSTLGVFTEALERRYGKASNLEDYAIEAQALAYEGHRAMFEAFGRNKYTATGVIQWMLNNAWPSMIWHLYDYYLRPGGSYFGAKKACEPLHIQYSYDDRSIVIVNSYYKEFRLLRADARVYNLDASEKFSHWQMIDVGPDSATRVFTIPEIAGLSSAYFVKLTLRDSAGKVVSSNFYWLSTKPETLDWEKSTWYDTPTKSFADLTALQSLPGVKLRTTARYEKQGEETVARVKVENPGRNIAFLVRLRLIRDADGEEVLPVFWEDNYFSLMPGESRELTATCATRGLERGNAKPLVVASGWNVQ